MAILKTFRNVFDRKVFHKVKQKHYVINERDVCHTPASHINQGKELVNIVQNSLVLCIVHLSTLMLKTQTNNDSTIRI